jgi:hypothetical protein
MQGSVVAMMDIGKTLIPCARVLGIMHVQYMNDHSIYDPSLAIFRGWKVVDLVSLVSSSDQRLDQNVLRNQLSRSETILCGIPKCTQTRSKKSLAMDFVVMLFLQATRITILEKQLTTTKTQSFPHLVNGRPDM